MIDAARPEEVDAAVALVWQRMRPTILARVERLEQGLEACQNAFLSEPLRSEALLEAHRLAGSLGMFGFPEGSALAKELERALEAGLEKDAATRYAERLRQVKESLGG